MAEQKSKEQVKAEMDAAAEAAKLEFDTMLDQASPDQQTEMLRVVAWVAANYMAAGYKRLGRILVALAKAAK